MRVIYILAGGALLLLAVGGVVCWVTGFEMFKEMLMNDVPVFFEHGGKQTEIPGRLIGALVFTVPIVGTIAGVWLLRLGFEAETKRDCP